MDQFIAWISRIMDSWKFWVVIAPWEVGVRVRLGKKAVAMVSGFHLRVPFVDEITLVNTRLRIDGTPPVTVHGAKPGYSRCISATVSYRVSDPLAAMMHYGLPYSAVISKTQGAIASTCDETGSLNLLQEFFNPSSGIAIESVTFVEDVEVRTYRLLNGGTWVAGGHESISGQGSMSLQRY